MRSTTLRFGSLLPLMGSAACGGGGDDGSPFAGVWNGNVVLVEDTCGVVGSDSLYFTHLVSGDETSVTLDNGFESFTGAPSSDRGFSVSRDKGPITLADGRVCSGKVSWRYEEVRRDTAQFVVRSSDLRCSKGGQETQCRYAFSGSAYRSTGGRIFVADQPGPAEDSVQF